MNCQEAIDVMEEAVEGHLPPALATGFDGHITECRSCRTYLEHLRITRRALQLLPRPRGTSPHRTSLIEEFKAERKRRRD